MRRRQAVLVLAALAGWAVAGHGAEYWVAPDGDDAAGGNSRAQAWASPSRGQPTCLRETYSAGGQLLTVRSTDGFLPTGRVTVGGETHAYIAKTPDTLTLAEPFSKDLAAQEPVYDADILGGDSFEPGDVINLAGGTYMNCPLDFRESGAEGRPITYRSALGERAVLVSEVFNRAPIRRVGSWRSTWTEHVVLKDLIVRNSADGNHGAGGIELYGVRHLVVDGCDIDISGRDINGDNDAIKIFGARDVLITGCRLRSREANGVMAWQASDVRMANSVIYESFNGVLAAGGRFPANLTVENCTIYAIHRYSAATGETNGTVTVKHSIIAQTASAAAPALRRNGTGDYNLVWHTAAAYGEGWNGDGKGKPGPHDVHAAPMFISRNPADPNFLRIPAGSPAATGGEGGGHIGAFAPIASPALPDKRRYDVRAFGATGDGVHDDLPAVTAAIEAAREAGGGVVVLPPTDKHYLVSDTIRVTGNHIDLTGPGATIKLKPGAGRMDLITIGSRSDGPARGPAGPVVEHVTLEGFTLDGSYRSQPQKRAGNNPRGVWAGNAHHVELRNLTIRDTFCGVTFGPGSRDCRAIDVTVTDWDHDGFGASGRGINGGCTDIAFVRCRAVKTPGCVKAWEIEEGAQRVRLEDCLVDDLGGTGTGYYVRHHEYRWPLLVDDVEFLRCEVRNVTGAGFLIVTVPGEAARPTIRTRNVRLIDCKADGRVAIAAGVEDVLISGGRYDGTMFLGVGMNDPEAEQGAKWPVRSVTIENARVGELVVNARTGNPSGELGHKYYPDYEPRVVLRDTQVVKPLKVYGDRSNVVIEKGARRRGGAMRKEEQGDGLPLVRDGAATGTIVIAEDADWWQRMAAGWLQEYVEKATGARLPIEREGALSGGARISVGHTRLARDAGVTVEGLKWDGCRLMLKGDVVFLIGRDGEGVGRGDPSPDMMKKYEADPWRADRGWGMQQADLAGANGTCKAVVTFLEDVCGVRWFMPFEQGIRVPKRRDLAVPRDLDKTVTPVFAYANGMFPYGSPRFSPATYANNFRYGIRLKTFGGHSWYHWVPAGLFDEHPEYFAMRGGKRTAEGGHLCTTNPEVKKLLLKGIRAEFDKGYDWVQLGQSDDWKRCECSRCEARDAFRPYDAEVDGPDWFKWLYTTNRDNPVERLHLLHNSIAEACAGSHPGRIVHFLAYIPTRWPSKALEKYSPNLVAEICKVMPKMLDDWAEKVSAMTVYEYWWDMSWVYGYRPDVTPKEVADRIRDFRDHGVIGFFNGGDGHNWGLNGPVFYVLGKLLGDPDLDEYTLMEEYCLGVYGDAGEAMNEFFLCLYKRPMRKAEMSPDAPQGENVRTIFPPRVIRDLEERLAAAEAVGVSGAAADNLRMTRLQMDYLRLVSHMWIAWEAYGLARTPAAVAELRTHVDAFEDYRRMILHMDPDGAARRFPDWGSLCKWLTGSHYWNSWYQVKDKVDIEAVRGTPVGYYAKIRKPLTLDFEELAQEAESRRGKR